MNYYEELGISPNAGEIEIRRVYRRMVKIFHPDQYLDPEVKAIAGREMIRLNEIVLTLTNPERRWRYDRSLLVGLDPLPAIARPGLARRLSMRIEKGWQQVRATVPSLGDVFALLKRPIPATILAICLMALLLGAAGLAGVRRRGEIAQAQAAAHKAPDSHDTLRNRSQLAKARRVRVRRGD